MSLAPSCERTLMRRAWGVNHIRANKRCWSSTAWPLWRLTAATRSEDLMARMLDFAEAGVLAQGHASMDRLEEGRR